MSIRWGMVLVLAFGLAAIEARAGHHEGGAPGLQKKVQDLEDSSEDVRDEVSDRWKAKKDKKEKKAKKPKKDDRSASRSGSDSDSGASKDHADSDSSSSASGSKSASADSTARSGRSKSKPKSNAARERLTAEEREALRAEEGPGFLGRMRRFFGFERSAERRSAPDPEIEDR